MHGRANTRLRRPSATEYGEKYGDSKQHTRWGRLQRLRAASHHGAQIPHALIHDRDQALTVGALHEGPGRHERRDQARALVCAAALQAGLEEALEQRFDVRQQIAILGRLVGARPVV